MTRALNTVQPLRRPGRTARRRLTLRAWFARGGLSPILFAIPVVLIFLYFSWGPIISSLLMAWQKTNLVTPASWVGLSNFQYVLSDPILPKAALNTLYFVVLAIVFGFPVPLFLAVFMAELRGRNKTVYSALSYLPAVVPPVVAVLLWQTFYNPSNTGVFNEILHWFGLGPFTWLSSQAMAMPSIVLEVTWATAGSTAIIYLAALSSVRAELYEAAELDGAGIWSRVWHVTLPQIRGVILIMFLLQIIGTAQVFTEPYIFTDGGPNNATTTVLLLIYRYAFINNDYGAATALSFLLAIVLALFSVAYQISTRKWSTN
ncbi:carbohydrate ABC transporter permease [Gryllotalpicola reticulitermitis]|uniref:Carbohydrate ABC transporter permease n=1 Tax=Gryllotalpicola reticulitermitis TaxID=1184153 RepID=A0ABV8Q7T9_9MICO